jgi:large repetitive protein
LPIEAYPINFSMNRLFEQVIRMQRSMILMAVVGMVLAVAGVATAGSINAGDIIVVDRVNGTLDEVNPTTGASTVIASGFSNPQGVAINAQGMIFVSDIGTHTIDEVNPMNGIVTTFSGNGVGSGAVLDRPFEMAFNSSGTLFVADGQANSNDTNVIAIASNGDRTVVAGNNGSSTNVFAQSLAGLTINPTTGNLYVSTATGHTIYQVTPGGSVTTVFTNTTAEPQGLAFSSGQVLYANGGTANPAVFSVNPGTGIATLVSNDFTVGSSDLFGLAVGSNGTIYATSVSSPDVVIYAIDPTTGNATTISGNGIGGTTFGALSYGIAVYPAFSATIPEPSSAVLLALGVIGVILLQIIKVSR